MFTVAKQCIKLGSSTGLHQLLYTHAVKAGAGVVGSQPPSRPSGALIGRERWLYLRHVTGNSGTAVPLAQGPVFVGDAAVVRTSRFGSGGRLVDVVGLRGRGRC